jgi:cytochrome c oxidase assembly protein subunit 15
VEFAKYRQIPEYQQINKGMSLDAFKRIFWWEWAHRFLARALGLVFAVPLAWFWLTGKLERRLKPRLLVLLVLGGMQGVVGWWMVYSGLSERTDVSQYRLAVHLTLASVIFAAILYVARGLAPHTAGRAPGSVRTFAGWLVLAVLVQIYLGGLVAGLDAGLSYNTWPLMDGAVVPGGLFVQSPWWINLFENPKTVQFVHRMSAFVVTGLVIAHWFSTNAAAPRTPHARRAALLVGLVILQAVIGIATLLSQVSLHTALTHQGLALVVLGFAVAHWRGTKGAYGMDTAIERRS